MVESDIARYNSPTDKIENNATRADIITHARACGEEDRAILEWLQLHAFNGSPTTAPTVNDRSN